MKLDFKKMVSIFAVLIISVLAYYVRNPIFLIIALFINLVDIAVIAKNNMDKLKRLLKK